MSEIITIINYSMPPLLLAPSQFSAVLATRCRVCPRQTECTARVYSHEPSFGSGRGSPRPGYSPGHKCFGLLPFVKKIRTKVDSVLVRTEKSRTANNFFVFFLFLGLGTRVRSELGIIRTHVRTVLPASGLVRPSELASNLHSTPFIARIPTYTRMCMYLGRARCDNLTIF